MIRYIITTHRDRDGARLSLPGHWTNEPFASVQAAEEGAAKDADGRPFTIDREHIRQHLTEFSQ